jgi:transcriptional regulator with XRE-family HTH domain
VRRRLVGAALRRYRENVGYTLEDAARVLECDRSKISRVETGQRGIRPKELRELLAEYGVPAGEQDAVTAIAGRGGQRGGWWHSYPDVLSAHDLDYVIMESAASQIMTYEAQLVPDLLQTDDYARALAAAEPRYASDQQRDDAVAVKAERRQAVLGGRSQGHADDPVPRLGVILGEGALRQAVGGPSVLAGQLAHLVRLSEESPGLAIQVLPFSAGAHAAAGGGSLTIMRFANAPGLGVVYLEALSGGVYLENQEDVVRYMRAFTLLRTSALSVADSARLLSSLGSLWSSGRGLVRRTRACGVGGHAAARSAQLLGDGRELVDDVLDVLQRAVVGARLAGTVAVVASGGTGPAGVIIGL